MLAHYLLVIWFVLTSFLGNGQVVPDILPNSEKAREVCLEKKDLGEHSIFTDWMKAFHRYNTFQTYPHLTTSLLMDIKESKDEYLLHVDMPGAEKDKIKITISPNQREMRISAFKEGLKHEEGEDFKLVERVTGHLNRIVYLPDSADVDKMKAKYKNGILEVVIPKLSKNEEDHKIRYIIVD